MRRLTVTPTLRELEARMCQLVATRNERVAAGEAIIRAANRDFDRAALTLGREINRLRAEQEPETPPPAAKKNRTRPAVLDGLDEAEQLHYLQLAGRIK